MFWTESMYSFSITSCSTCYDALKYRTCATTVTQLEKRVHRVIIMRKLQEHRSISPEKFNLLVSSVSWQMAIMSLILGKLMFLSCLTFVARV
ncbi:hypothetical protein WN55_04248 [Dufourea novaeangliae]|uniref:Uncharacterized protein n=1 Tax=Dufourea novaeangliae TaxID=178035 RepID=A0A154NW41_DUFNO|nr:hypothetical protein WN55_04248 [Dufourea novaeangliae]